MAEDLRPFRVEVPEAVLDDLRDRLGAHALARPDPRLGLGLRHRPRVPPGPVRDLAHEFDWRAQEARFNRWPHFLTDIDGKQVHFIHARSPEPDAFPLVITHGWPGSVSEFLDVIDPLVRPARARRRSDRRVPRRLPVDPRLRLVGPDDANRVGTSARRRGVEDADGAPRLRPLRRAGRRLGRDHLGDARPRSTPRTSPACTSTC